MAVSTNLLPAATALATAALSVIPANAGNKKPELESWKPYQAQPATMPEVTAWFTPNGHTPPTAIAVICGAVSGGLTVLDFDTLPNGATLYEEWAGIVEAAMPGLLARLPVVQTPSGGRHVYLRCAVCDGNAKLAESAGLPRLTWIETRGEGGYVLAPITPGYRTLQGTLKAIPTLEPAERALLLTAARTLTKYVPAHGTHIDTDSLPGAAFNAKHTTADMRRWLEGAGWAVAGEHADGTTLLRRPGKRDGISATLGQGGMRSFYVFSSNAAPFEPNQGYSAFAVHTLLEHGGDYGASARQLAQDGFGGQRAREPESKREYNRPDPQEGAEGAEGVEHSAPWFVKPMQHALPAFDSTLLLAPSLIAFHSEAMRVMDMPGEFFLAPMLATAGACIGATHRLRIMSTWHESALLWTCVVGPPGSGKTPSASQVTDPVHAIQEAWYRAWKEEQRRYEEELAEWQEGQKGQRGDRPTKPEYRRLLTSNTTLEALVPILDRNPHGVLLERDELVGWIKSFNQYKKQGGSDREDWLSIWSSKSFPIDRKSDGYSVYLSHPFVGVTGGIQPEKLQPLLGGVDDGFTDRLILFWPFTHPMELQEVDLSEEVREGYKTLLKKLLALTFGVDSEGRSIANTVRLSDAAWRLFKRRHDALQKSAHDPDIPARLRNAYSKMGSHAARIALVLHVALMADCGMPTTDPLDEDTIAAAWQIVDIAMAHLDRIHGELGGQYLDARAQKAIAWIERNGGKATVREILRHNVVGIKAATAAKRLFEDLADRHLGTVAATQGRGGEHVEFTIGGDVDA